MTTITISDRAQERITPAQRAAIATLAANWKAESVAVTTDWSLPEGYVYGVLNPAEFHFGVDPQGQVSS